MQHIQPIGQVFAKQPGRHTTGEVPRRCRHQAHLQIRSGRPGRDIKETHQHFLSVRCEWIRLVEVERCVGLLRARRGRGTTSFPKRSGHRGQRFEGSVVASGHKTSRFVTRAPIVNGPGYELGQATVSSNQKRDIQPCGDAKIESELLPASVTVEREDQTLRGHRNDTVDVSCGGCRLRFHRGANLPIPSSLKLPIPTAEVPITGTPVWRESSLDGEVCGVAVGGASDAEGAWRSFVDGLASRL